MQVRRQGSHPVHRRHFVRGAVRERARREVEGRHPQADAARESRDARGHNRNPQDARLRDSVVPLGLLFNVCDCEVVSGGSSSTL